MTVPTDRAQDTEAIRAAPYSVVRERARKRLARFPSADARGTALDAAIDAEREIDRLVARLEAAERERDEAQVLLDGHRAEFRYECKRHGLSPEVVLSDFEAETLDEARAALAAAAPGETTAVPGRYQGGTDDEGCKGSWPGCMDDGCNWPSGPCAALGETEQTP